MVLWHSLAMLVVLSGLPGSGKTTVGRVVAELLTAAYIRIDALEAAMWRAGIEREQPTGLAARRKHRQQAASYPG